MTEFFLLNFVYSKNKKRVTFLYANERIINFFVHLYFLGYFSEVWGCWDLPIMECYHISSPDFPTVS